MKGIFLLLQSFHKLSVFSLFALMVGCTSTEPPSVVQVEVSGLNDAESFTVELYIANFSSADASMTVSANGTHDFPAYDPEDYIPEFSLLIGEQPTNQTCTVSEPFDDYIYGTQTYNIVCSDTTHTLSGTLSGLASGESLSLAVNRDYVTEIDANGAFTIDAEFAQGSEYEVTIAATPRNQRCTISPASGTVSEDISLTVTCNYAHFIFEATNSWTTADFGGRAAADQVCTNFMNTSGSTLSCSGGVKAFLSVDADDEIRDIPELDNLDTSLPIYGLFVPVEYEMRALEDNNKMADNWDDLLDGSLDQASGVRVSWTGSNADGSLHSNACEGWTSTDASNETRRSTHWLSNTGWVSDSTNCGEELLISCICMQEADAEAGDDGADDGDDEGDTAGDSGGEDTGADDGSDTGADAGGDDEGADTGGEEDAGDSGADDGGDAGTDTGGEEDAGDSEDDTGGEDDGGDSGTDTGGEAGADDGEDVDPDDPDGDGVLTSVEAQYAYVPLVHTKGTIAMTADNVALYRGHSETFRRPTGITVVATGLDPDVDDANEDFDGDTETNAEEITLGGSIFIRFTDGNFTSVDGPEDATVGDRLAIGDFNEDGNLDVLQSSIFASAVLYFPGDGDGTFSAATTIDIGTQPGAMAVADFDHDGNLDFAVVDGEDDLVYLYYGAGDGTFTAGQSYATGVKPYDVALGDFNEDNALDLVITNQGDSWDGTTLSILRNNAATTARTFTMLSPITTAEGPNDVVVADFDNDDHLDLAVSHSGSDGNSQTVSIHWGEGNGTFHGTPATTLTAGVAPAGMTVGDFNADGLLDLAVANLGAFWDGDTISVFLNAGSGAFDDAVSYEVGVGPASIAAFDSDDDGDNILDLLVTNIDDSIGTEVTYLRGQGDGTFVARTPINASSGPNHLVIGDLNNDGALDVVINNTGGSELSVFLNEVDE